MAVGDVTDHLAVRITDCQIGCFKVDKTAHDDQVPGSLDAEMITLLEALHESRRLTCAKVFDLAREFKLKPMAIADEANRRRIKVSECQLGCF